MITQEPTRDNLEAWKALWLQTKDKLVPNRKSGAELLAYLQDKYGLTEIVDDAAASVVAGNVTMNPCHADKLPQGAAPVPRTFFVENTGHGQVLYRAENRGTDLWGGADDRIFVGIDTASGFFTVEGSTLLWDELYVFRGLDQSDIQNYVCVAEYISCLERVGLGGDSKGGGREQA